MTQRWSHRMDGLEPDNLLAFLALLGTLRALEIARPEWAPRAYWDIDTYPWRPVLSLRAETSREEIVEAAAGGADALAESQDFAGRKGVDFSRDEAIDQLTDENQMRRRAMECLLTPGAYKDEGKPIPTPYCLMFGQGNQHFLQRFSSVAARRSPPDRGRGKQAVVVSAAACLSEALFEPWQRADRTDSFRWDLGEANRYALRALKPSGDPTATTTQHGANRLAALALPLLPACAISRRGEPRTLAVGARYDRSGTIRITWPIWTRPARLSGILASLDLTPARQIKALDVVAYMEAERISLGKFMNVAPARMWAVNEY